MCGRTCLTLAPDQVTKTFGRYTKGHKEPEWVGSKKEKEQYKPSPNLAPTRFTPVLVMGQQVGTGGAAAVKTMMWKLVPEWFQGDDPAKSNLTTNNARIEGLRDGSSKLYKRSIEHNRRCVVICDGFYEWHKIKSNEKQPYLVSIKGDDADEDNKGKKKDKPFLLMAGIYSIWKPKDGGAELYSYSVVTMPSEGSELSWLHDRMPAILADEDAVQRWLDPKQEGVDAVKALAKIKKGQVTWHAVSKDVGNVKNQGETLPNPIKLEKEAAGGIKKFFKPKNEKADEGPDEKKIKKEEK